METDIEVLVATFRDRLVPSGGLAFRRREPTEQEIKELQERHEPLVRDFRRKASAILGYVTQEYSPVRLHDWFLLDNWTPQEALVLLCGFDPTHVLFDEHGNIVVPHDESGHDFQTVRSKVRIRRLDNLPIYDTAAEMILGKWQVSDIEWQFKKDHHHLLSIWKSGTHTESRYPPKYFIDWAIQKKFPIRWLAWAIANHYHAAVPTLVGGAASAANDSRDIHPRTENNLLHIIGALTDLYWNAVHPDEKYVQAVLLDELKKYEGFPGLSERHLKTRLPQARKLIRP
jgi:hypothetical protein